jgi:hypothetical protein
MIDTSIAESTTRFLRCIIEYHIIFTILCFDDVLDTRCADSTAGFSRIHITVNTNLSWFLVIGARINLVTARFLRIQIVVAIVDKRCGRHLILFGGGGKKAVNFGS